MLLSKSCQYAIRAMVFIHNQTRHDDRKIGIPEIAKGISSPVHFTAKILQVLSKGGMIFSQKGPGGGFKLNENTSEVCVLDIIEAIEGPQFCDRCLLGLPNCSDSKPCPSHYTYKPIRFELKKMFQETTIGFLSDNMEKESELFRLGD